MSAVMLAVHGNIPVTYIPLKGLTENCMYREAESGKIYAAEALMEVGIPLPLEMGEYQSYQMYFTRVSA